MPLICCHFGTIPSTSLWFFIQLVTSKVQFNHPMVSRSISRFGTCRISMILEDLQTDVLLVDSMVSTTSMSSFIKLCMNYFESKIKFHLVDVHRFAKLIGTGLIKCKCIIWIRQNINHPLTDKVICSESITTLTLTDKTVHNRYFNIQHDDGDINYHWIKRCI